MFEIISRMRKKKKEPNRKKVYRKRKIDYRNSEVSNSAQLSVLFSM